VRYVEVAYRYDAENAVRHDRPADADAALRRLDEGSRAFADLLATLAQPNSAARRVIQVDPADLGLATDYAGAPAQHPYAAVLGCSDARVPIELIFNEGPNDLFVVRVAGNALGGDVLASLEYALDHLGESLKLVVVLGHSGCGALTAAVDVFLNPAGYLELASQHVLRGLLDRLVVVVHGCAKRMAAVLGADVVRRPGYRDALVELAVLTNAALGAYSVQQTIDSRAGAVRAAYGVYVIDRREVWAPRAGSTEVAGLAPPPHDASAFASLADAAIASRRIASLLDGKR
jgi:carbonic anhydrase